MSTNIPIPYILRRSRRTKRLRLMVYADGRCVVSAPWFVSKRMVQGLVEEKADWIAAQMKGAKPSAPVLTIQERKALFDKNKAAALLLVTCRLEFFNETYKFRWNAVRMKNSRTRWGSCSGKGNLNFHYRLVHLPAELSDYIIVHELCHLKELNHSKKFWALVAKTVPDFKERKERLRREGGMLQ